MSWGTGGPDAPGCGLWTADVSSAVVPTRRLLLTGLVGVAVVATGCAAATSEPAGPDPATLSELDAMVSRLSTDAVPGQDYRSPDADERVAALAALDPLLAGDTGPGTVTAFDRLGLDVASGTDAPTGRPFVVAASRSGAERSWGAIVMDRGAPASVLVEVPHVRADRNTEDVGLALYRAVPGAVLLIAGAHRRAAGERADVAHQSDSFFHAVATHVGGRGLPELQLHGFDTDTLPAVDAVISPGAGPVGPAATAVADALSGAGLAVCRAWAGDDCGSLEGRTNEQGRAAAASGRPFVHIELSPDSRDADGRRTEVVAALARAAVAPA